VDAHPDPDLAVGRPGLRGERPLRVGRRRKGIARPLEDDEEAIAFGRDLDAAVGGDRCPDQVTVTPEQRAPAFRTQRLGERGRALDVGEDEGDRPGRQ